MDHSNRQKLLDPQTLAKLQGLQLRAPLIVEGYVSGVHRSPFHGFSIEFAEHREYSPGDDLRISIGRFLAGPTSSTSNNSRKKPT